MKKLWSLIVLAVVLVAGCNGDDKYEKADILIFTQQGCPHCEKAMEYINHKLLVKNPEINVEQVDITYDRDNMRILQKYMAKYKIKSQNIGTPVLVFKQQMLVGWGIENRAKLQRAFAK